MLKEITIKKITKYEKGKDGRYYTYIDKTGNQHRFIRVVINDGENQMSHIAFSFSDPILDWKEGEKYLVVVKKEGNFLNFDKPTKLDVLEDRIEKLENFVYNKEKAEKSEAENNFIDEEEKTEDGYPLSSIFDERDNEEIPF